jgi:putative DNA primase/helicase
MGRLIAAQAVMHRVANVSTGNELLTIPDDVDELARVCRQLRIEGRPVALVVVDPISAFLGGVDSHRDAAVRGALAPLAKLAQSENVCVLAVAHLNKSSAGNLLNRISGSGAFGAAPRSVLAFARDPDDPEGEQGSHRVIVHAKSNHGRYAPTLAAHIEAPTVAEVGSTVSRLVIDGETELSADDLRPDRTRNGSSSEDVDDAILENLAGGQRASREVKAAVAQLCDVTPRTVERAAARMVKRGELIASRSGFPAVGRWELSQLRRDQSRHDVVTEDVAAKDRQLLRAIRRNEGFSRDTGPELSPLDGSEVLGRL